MGQQIGLLHSTVSLCVYVSQLPTDGLSESKPFLVYEKFALLTLETLGFADLTSEMLASRY